MRTIILTISLALSLAIVSCGEGKNNTTSASDNTTQTDQSSVMSDTMFNGLSEKEKSDGWRLLFDGKSMNGWRTYQNKKTDSWSVSDGTLYCKGSASDKSDLRADLITTDQFENTGF